MKRVISAMLIFITVIGLMPAALAEAAPGSPYYKAICLMDANTGAVLYEKDARSKAYPASTTKIMTTILALELCDDLEEKVNVGSNFDKRGSLMKFSNNEELRVIDLIYGTMMVSGNDAASALAIHISGSQDEFSKANERQGRRNRHERHPLCKSPTACTTITTTPPPMIWRCWAVTLCKTRNSVK